MILNYTIVNKPPKHNEKKRKEKKRKEKKRKEKKRKEKNNTFPIISNLASKDLFSTWYSSSLGRSTSRSDKVLLNSENLFSAKASKSLTLVSAATSLRFALYNHHQNKLEMKEKVGPKILSLSCLSLKASFTSFSLRCAAVSCARRSSASSSSCAWCRARASARSRMGSNS